MALINPCYQYVHAFLTMQWSADQEWKVPGSMVSSCCCFSLSKYTTYSGLPSSINTLTEEANINGRWDNGCPLHYPWGMPNLLWGTTSREFFSLDSELLYGAKVSLGRHSCKNMAAIGFACVCVHTCIHCLYVHLLKLLGLDQAFSSYNPSHNFKLIGLIIIFINS